MDTHEADVTAKMAAVERAQQQLKASEERRANGQREMRRCFELHDDCERECKMRKTALRRALKDLG